MSTYIFMCSGKTEAECLERNLFGGTKSYVKAVPSVQVGDTLFLYNYELGTLHGEFEAVSEAGLNIEKDAWRGKYPWQVRVKRVKALEPLQRKELESLEGFTFTRQGYPPASVADELLSSLRMLFSSPSMTAEDVEYRKVNPALLPTHDGHYVRSQAEQRIDNWLYEHRVAHAYEVKLGDGEGFCDFYVPTEDGSGVYIEYWGLKGGSYERRQKDKLAWYKKKRVELLQLTSKDLSRLDKVLGHLVDRQKKSR